MYTTLNCVNLNVVSFLERSQRTSYYSLIERLIHPISPFIKNRIELLASSNNYEHLLEQIVELNICEEGFKVDYVVVNNDPIERDEKRVKLKDIGYRINAVPGL